MANDNPIEDRLYRVTDGPESWVSRYMEIVEANGEDTSVCTWLRDARVGDVLDEGHGLRVERIR